MRHSAVRVWQDVEPLSELQDRDLFTLVGTRRLGPELWQPTVEQYLACRHSQRSFARLAMGETAARAFDAELCQVLTELCSSGEIRCVSDKLQLGAEAMLAWAVPQNHGRLADLVVLTTHAREIAHTYGRYVIDLSQAYAPLLVVVCGLSFAGKTTLGSALARRFNYKEVDVDLTKVRLYGVTSEENALDQEAWNRIYDETDREIAQHLKSGTSLVDASRNFRKEERSHARRIAGLNGGDFLLIYIDTPEHVARERLLANRRSAERVDWGDISFDEIVRAMEAPGDDEHALIYHYEDDVERWISEHFGCAHTRSPRIEHWQ